MQITNSNTNNINFKTIIVPDKSVRTNILRSLNNKQLNSLKTELINHTSNPVDAIISSEKNRLKAKLYCPYRLKNFKENYKQFFFFESNVHFLKRIMKKCNEYYNQLK